MYKRLSILTFALLALAGCIKNNPVSPEEIPMLFSAVASHSTKGIIATTNYPVDVPFEVQAVYYPHPGSREGSYTFIEQQKVTFDSGYGNWKTGSDYFWPERGKLHFYAGSPAVPALTVSADHGVQADWQIESDEQAHTDLCFAEATEECANHSIAVPVVFSHALSQVCFKARPLKNYSFSNSVGQMVQANVISVVLDSVKVRGIVSRGHFTQNPLGWTNLSPATTDYKIFGAREGEEGLELGCDRYENPVLTTFCTMLLIPQTISEEAELEEWHHMKIRSSITDPATGEIVSDIRYTIPYSSRLPLSKCCSRWALDYKYTFRLALGMEDSELVAAVTDWTETKEIILGDE